MLVTVILALSILLQFAAAGIALWLFRVRTVRWAWMLIATAITLMAFRRCITMMRVLSGDMANPPDLSAEWVALLISSCMVVGLGLLVRPWATDADRPTGDILQGASDRRLSRTAVGLGALAIVGSCAVAGYSYNATRQARLRDVSAWVQHEAKQIAGFTERFQSDPIDPRGRSSNR